MDWEKFHNMKDSDIDFSDMPEADDDWFKKAVLVIPPNKKMVSIRLDGAVIEWFKLQGKGYQTRINEVLKMYMKAKSR